MESRSITPDLCGVDCWRRRRVNGVFCSKEPWEEGRSGTLGGCLAESISYGCCLTNDYDVLTLVPLGWALGGLLRSGGRCWMRRKDYIVVIACQI